MKRVFRNVAFKFSYLKLILDHQLIDVKKRYFHKEQNFLLLYIFKNNVLTVLTFKNKNQRLKTPLNFKLKP